MRGRNPYESGPTMRMDAAVAPSGDVLAIGTLLDRTYEIRGLLGQGGMGQVYDAFDVRLQRAVAIKVAWPTVDPATIRNEARALATIRHPSVIAVFACGEHEGIEYVVMERLNGVDLETDIRRRSNARKPLALREALDILASVADGLAAVHRAGIAHRDVKPDNVMLAPGGRTVLMDFGVFVAEFEAGTHGSTSGSPAYMAPETISGTVGTGGGFLVDLYAFGVLAFELLAGALPFPADTPQEVLLKHLSADVPRLRDRVDVPPALDELVHELLAKDPFARPQGMEEVLHRLRRLQAAAALDAPPHSGPTSQRTITGRQIKIEEVPVHGSRSTQETHTRRRGG